MILIVQVPFGASVIFEAEKDPTPALKMGAVTSPIGAVNVGDPHPTADVVVLKIVTPVGKVSVNFTPPISRLLGLGILNTSWEVPPGVMASGTNVFVKANVAGSKL